MTNGESNLSQANYVFMDGEYVPYEDAKLPVRTHAFLYGTSIFEGIRAYWNEEKQELYAFRMKEHFDRMLNNCKIMHMELPYTSNDLCDITIELLKKKRS